MTKKSDLLMINLVLGALLLGLTLLRMPIVWYVAGVGSFFMGETGQGFLFLGIGAVLHLIFASRGA